MFCGLFAGPPSNTAERGVQGAEKGAQASLAIDALASQSIRQDGDLKGTVPGLEDTVNTGPEPQAHLRVTVWFTME